MAYASTCNSVGQTAGYMFGYVAFIALESASFCNAYIRHEPLEKGIVTLSGKFKKKKLNLNLTIIFQRFLVLLGTSLSRDNNSCLAV